MKKSILLIILSIAYTSITSQTTIREVMLLDSTYSEKISIIEANSQQIFLNSDSAEQKRYIRMKSFVGPRLDENGTFVEYRTQWNNTYNYLNSNPVNQYNSGLELTLIGPREVNMTEPNHIGRVECIAKHPTNNNIVYIGTANGGLWKTENMLGSNTQWEHLTSHFPGVGVFAIAFHPTNPSIMVIVTGSHVWSTFLLNRMDYGTGVFISTDGGDTWTISKEVDSADNIAFRDIKFDINNPNTIYALANDRIYKTTDLGNIWDEKMLPTNGAAYYISLTISTNNSNLLLASGTSILSKSIDGGDNWFPISEVNNLSINDYLTNVGFSTNTGLFYLLLYIDNDITPILYSLNVVNGVFDTWTNTNINTCYYTSPNLTLYYGINFYIHDPLVINDHGIFIGTGSHGYVYKYDESDFSTFSRRPFGHVDFRGLTSINSDIHYIANDGGVVEINFASGGSLVSHCGDLSLFHFVNVAITEADPDLIMGDAHDVGLWTKDGILWKKEYGDGGFCTISRVNKNVRYRNYWKTLMYYTKLTLLGDYEYYKTFPEYNGRRHGTPIATHPHLEYIAYTDGDYHDINGDDYSDIIKHSDYTRDFDVIFNSVLIGRNLIDIAIPYSNPNRLLISSSTSPTELNPDSRLYDIDLINAIVVNITESLQQSDPTNYEIFKNTFTTDLEINTTNENEFWVSIAGFSLGNKVFHTIDGGLTFNNISYNLTNIPVNALKYDNIGKRLYLGTDFGLYFLDDGTNLWEQDEDIESMMFVDIEINRKTYEMYFSAWGRGFWKADLPCPDVDPDPLEITSNQEWEIDKWTNQDIVVKSNYELKIKDCSLFFVAENRIVVEAGARLILDNCTISTNSCIPFWKGIELKSVKGEHQSPENSPTYQGYVNLINGATIENAECAISTIAPGMGGVIKAYDSHFINNKIAINYFPYQYFLPVTGITVDNKGYVENCSFDINDEYPGDANDNFLYHAKLQGVSGVKFMACNFSNSQTDKVYNLQNNDNMAIFTFDAGVIISGKCNVGVAYGYSCPELDLDRTIFNGFYKAVNLTGAASNTNSIIKQCDFNNNLVGIEINNTDNVSIFHNFFEVGNCDIVGYQKPVSGIKVVSSTGYRVEENTINITEPTTLNYEDNAGISIQNCDLDNNQIYKNYIIGVKYAIVPAGINKTLDPYTGLQLLCNVFDDSQKRDIDVTKDPDDPGSFDGIRTHQGVVEQSAANIFTVDHTDFQFHLANATQNPFTYYYNDDTDPNFKPTKLTTFVDAIDEVIQPDINDPNNVIITPVVANSCPSNIDNDLYYPMPISKETEVISSFNSAKISYWNIYYSYLQEIDDGNTPAMLLLIQNTWSQEAWDMRNGLIEQAPFVSEDALREAALTGVLPDAMLLEVCIANPDATRSGEFLDFLANEIPNPLPAYMIDMICANWDTRTARTSFEVELAKHGAEMDFYQSVLLANEKLRDEKDSSAIISYYQQRDNLSDRYALADYYVNIRDISQSQSIITQIPVDFELNDEQLEENSDYSDFLNYMNLHLLRDSANFLYTTAEIDELELLANSGNGNASYKAQNLLCFGYGLCEDYPVVPSDSLQPKSLSISGNPQDVINNYYYDITVSPNPASSYTVFEWNFLLLERDIILQITDVTGKPVDEEIIRTKQGQFLWDTRNIKNGVYLYSLVSKQKLLNSGKVIIEK